MAGDASNWNPFGNSSSMLDNANINVYKSIGGKTDVMARLGSEAANRQGVDPNDPYAQHRQNTQGSIWS